MTKKKRLRKERRNPEPKPKTREDTWVLESEEATDAAVRLLSVTAREQGISIEEAAEATAQLEKDGWLRREPDGSVVLLTQEPGDTA